VGVFEWVLTSNGKDVKRGPVKVRIQGRTDQPDAVYLKAIEVAKQLDAGTYTGPKRIRVKS
jgi:hypothetical protein